MSLRVSLLAVALVAALSGAGLILAASYNRWMSVRELDALVTRVRADLADVERRADAEQRLNGRACLRCGATGRPTVPLPVRGPSGAPLVRCADLDRCAG